MLVKFYPFVVAGSLLAVLNPAVSAERGPGSGQTWNWEIQGGAAYQSDAGLNTGGEVNVSGAYASVSTSRRFGDGTRVGLSLGYGEDRYDFSGTNGFGGLDPWRRIRQATLSASVFHELDDQWTLYGIPSLRFNAEQGASLDDGLTVGLLAGASYRFSDSLTIGPGFGVFSEIEDDVSFFPILIVDWKITDNLSLETGRGFAASRGPGLQLRWRYSPDWEFAVGGRYEKNRFRLKDQGAAAGGVGEDSGVPLFVAAQYAVSSRISLNLIGGVETATEFRLEDAKGNPVARSDADTAPFVGATIRFRL
jgi:hypothetical protein